MRIVRFDMERYGHVSGEYLEFPADRGLHVVVGNNEAGKSTALKGLADALFGFGRGRENHPDDPRLGFTLRAQDGTEAGFVRRKTGRDKLLDSAGLPVPETALTRFLGGTGRERFLDVFGLDAERLRRAGRAIIAEEGEAGATLLQAQTGLRGLRQTVDYLDDEAKLLFGDGRGVRRIGAAVGTIKESRRLVADRSLSGADYLAAIEREIEFDSQLHEITQERQSLRQEQSQLERIRRTAPFRSELATLADRLAALGPAPLLPVDAAERFAADSEQLALSTDRMAREQAELDKLDAAEATLVQDPAALDIADILLPLAANLTLFSEMRRNRQTVLGQAAEGLRTIDAVARDLGIAERGGDLRARIPDSATRRAANRLLTKYQTRIGARAEAVKGFEQTRQIRDVEALALAALPALAEVESLRDAVEAGRDAGSIDEAVAAATDRLETEAAERDRRLARLAGWGGDADALEHSRVPLEDDANQLGAALDAAERFYLAAMAARSGHDEAIESTRVTLAGIEAAGTLPTREGLQAVRQRRDESWRALRRTLDEGRPPGTLTDDFERLVNEADAVADARQSELARLRDWEQRRQQAAELTAARPDLVDAIEKARATHDGAVAAWGDAWVPAGVTPSGPAAMREWVRDRANVLTAIASARTAVQTLGTISQRRDTLRTALTAFLDEPYGEQLAPPLLRAARLVELADKRDAVVRRLCTADAAVAIARKALDAFDGGAREWDQAWHPIAQRLALRPGEDPADTTELLSLWSRLDTSLGEWDVLQERVTAMDDALNQHESAVAVLAARLGLPVTETLISEQVERLRHAEHARNEAARVTSGRAERCTARDTLRRAADHAADRLKRLRQQAGVADDDALRSVIAAQATRAEISKRIAEQVATLRQQADGKTDAELADEAAVVDIDTIPGRIEVIRHRADEIDSKAKTLAENLLTTRQRLGSMRAGQDVSGPAHAIQDALTNIEDAAHRYVRVRLAHALLRGGIDIYRRSQQGPLLSKASGLFTALTGGRYERLEQDERERGEPIIVAVRPDGSTCQADALSEGTTDQLFLALRLASIALDTATSEPLPFIGDDLLVNFDDARATAALKLLSEFGKTTQVILFTHHPHLLALVPPGAASIHQLPRGLAS